MFIIEYLVIERVEIKSDIIELISEHNRLSLPRHLEFTHRPVELHAGHKYDSIDVVIEKDDIYLVKYSRLTKIPLDICNFRFGNWKLFSESKSHVIVRGDSGYRIIDLDTYKVVFEETIDIINKHYTKFPTFYLVISPDNNKIAITADKQLIIYELETAKLIATFKHTTNHNRISYFSRDSESIAIMMNNQSIEVYSLTTLQVINTIKITNGEICAF